jgi:hypothetical protein
MKKDDVLLVSDYGDEIRFLEEKDGQVIGYYVDIASGDKSESMLVEQIIMLAGDGNVGWKYVESKEPTNTPTK